jgi:hypothetical protein
MGFRYVSNRPFPYEVGTGTLIKWRIQPAFRQLDTSMRTTQVLTITKKVKISPYGLRGNPQHFC